MRLNRYTPLLTSVALAFSAAAYAGGDDRRGDRYDEGRGEGHYGDRYDGRREGGHGDRYDDRGGNGRGFQAGNFGNKLGFSNDIGVGSNSAGGAGGGGGAGGVGGGGTGGNANGGGASIGASTTNVHSLGLGLGGLGPVLPTQPGQIGIQNCLVAGMEGEGAVSYGGGLLYSKGGKTTLVTKFDNGCAQLQKDLADRRVAASREEWGARIASDQKVVTINAARDIATTGMNTGNCHTASMASAAVVAGLVQGGNFATLQGSAEKDCVVPREGAEPPATTASAPAARKPTKPKSDRCAAQRKALQACEAG